VRCTSCDRGMLAELQGPLPRTHEDASNVRGVQGPVVGIPRKNQRKESDEMRVPGFTAEAAQSVC